MGGVENKGQILIYQTENGQTKIEVACDGNTVWLSQSKMGELFQRDRTTINEHIKKILDDGELVESEVMTKVGNSHFSRQRPTQLYNLKMILAVGYKVNSRQGVHFRKWATNVLDEFARKGFAMNDELLKNLGGGNYFEELLERIRDIRSSEKVFYRKVLDLFATSIDYDAKSEITIAFFKQMQNKLIHSVVKRTAPELIADRANADLPFMGLQSFRGQRPQKHEAMVSKSYLKKEELEKLNLIVSAYLDIATLKAKERIPMHMKDWVDELSGFIQYQKRPVLMNAGTVSHEQAMEIASTEYDKYKQKSLTELTQAERDYLDTIHATYEVLEGKKPKKK